MRGLAGVLVLGGMEVNLDELEYIMEARKTYRKPFQQRKSGKEIADMCRAVIERRNDAIRYFQKNPSEAPKPKKKTVSLHLPVGCRMVQTSEP